MKSPEPSQIQSDLNVRSTFALSVTGILALPPIILMDFLTGNSMLGVIALCMIIMCIVNVVMIARDQYYPAINSYLLIPGTVLSLLYVVNTLGAAGMFWVYPVVISFYFIVSERNAQVANTVLLLALLPVLHITFDILTMVRAIVTLLVVSIFSCVFTRIINRQQQSLAQQVLIDPLTHLYNRSSLNATLSHTIALSRRLGTMQTLISIDLDNFKSINDSEGHAVGDSVLEQLGRLLSDNVRQSDYVFRVGGEEFLVLLTGADLEQGKLVAEKLRERIEQNKFASERPVTASMGVASLQELESAESWLKRCDDLLYSAKQHGRNCVAVS